MSGVTFKNLVVADGVFKQDTAIRTVIVPDGGLEYGSVLGEITASGKQQLSLLAASDGSEDAISILPDAIENDTGASVEVKTVVYVAGTFNSLGVTFGTGQTLANTYKSLDSVNIRIVEGRA